jgi:REP element-mobilizing transposase RayT
MTPHAERIAQARRWRGPPRFLGSASRRDLFLRTFEEVCQKYDFVVVGYVVMPEHFHILVSEPRIKTLSNRSAGPETMRLPEIPKV